MAVSTDSNIICPQTVVARPKRQLLLSILALWIFSAITCAALPFTHAQPRLSSLGDLSPLLVALAIGILVGAPLSVTARYICEVDLLPADEWSSSTLTQAALLGVLCWGLPIALIFVVEEFLQTSDLRAVVGGLIFWPLAGALFGLVMRGLARRYAGDFQGSH